MNRSDRMTARPTVFTHGCAGEGHEVATHDMLARRFAELLGFAFGGDCERATLEPPIYLIPRSSLNGEESARFYRIEDERDLLGGWVPEAYMATKAILHPLISPDAAAPPNWPAQLTFAARGLVLSGFAAFSSEDAVAAGTKLLGDGPVRLKPVHGKGGHGQLVVRNAREIEDAVSRISAINPPEDGFVLETDLADVVTYAVGQLRLPNTMISYCGTQSLTTDNAGEPAYGGSDLTVVAGGYSQLPDDLLPDEMAKAVELSAEFDHLADRHLPGLIASRRNYDVAAGIAANGARRMGIIDQSWRVGGATGAELVALDALLENPDARAVRAKSVELYGLEQKAPDSALICFQGEDPLVGPLLKCAFVEEIIAR